MNPSVRDVAYLVTIESPPVFPVILAMKHQNVSVVNKIDERVAAVASVLEIDGEVEKINNTGAVAVLGEFRQKHLLSIFVRDIPNHQ